MWPGMAFQTPRAVRPLRRDPIREADAMQVAADALDNGRVAVAELR